MLSPPDGISNRSRSRGGSEYAARGCRPVRRPIRHPGCECSVRIALPLPGGRDHPPVEEGAKHGVWGNGIRLVRGSAFGPGDGDLKKKLFSIGWVFLWLMGPAIFLI